MIDRYSISASADVIRERFSVDVPAFYSAKYNAAPTQLLPAITSAAPHGVSLFYWGTPPEWSKNKMLSERMINVRAELLDEKPALKKALKKNRCVIPADGFYGWKKIGKKSSVPYRFLLNSKDPFAIAGLWEDYEDTDGNQIQTFTMFTQVANEVVAPVMERMPVILSKSNERLWLDNNTDEEALTGMLTAYPAAAMTLYSVSPSIIDTSKDLPSMIIPAPPADQFGNLTLFD